MHVSYSAIMTPINGMIVAEIPDWGIIINGRDYKQTVILARNLIQDKINNSSSVGKLIQMPSKVNVNEAIFYDKSKSYIEMISLDE